MDETVSILEVAYLYALWPFALGARQWGASSRVVQLSLSLFPYSSSCPSAAMGKVKGASDITLISTDGQTLLVSKELLQVHSPLIKNLLGGEEGNEFEISETAQETE